MVIPKPFQFISMWKLAARNFNRYFQMCYFAYSCSLACHQEHYTTLPHSSHLDSWKTIHGIYNSNSKHGEELVAIFIWCAPVEHLVSYTN